MQGSLKTSCTSRYAIEDALAVLIYSYIYYRNISHLHELPIHVYGEISSMQLCNHTRCNIKLHMLVLFKKGFLLYCDVCGKGCINGNYLDGMVQTVLFVLLFIYYIGGVKTSW